jgi:hypothetical protein
VRSRKERSAAKNKAEPMPPTERNTTSSGKFGAKPAAIDETPTTTAPTVVIARSPYRSMKRPTNGSAIRRAKEKPEIKRPIAS